MGHVAGKYNIAYDPLKVLAVESFQIPATRSLVEVVLGFAWYHCHVVPNISSATSTVNPDIN